MNWLAWRQYRKQFLIFGIILVAFAAIAVFTGNHFWHSYQHVLATCKQNPANPSCSDINDTVFHNGGLALRVVLVTGLMMPLILGMFVGSPLLAREYEEGTNKLVWTQSVSRRKWLTAKLLWALVFAALYGLAIALLVSWWTRTVNAIGHSRFQTGQFDTQGIVPFAYSVFFTAVGIAMSAWFRKTMIALAVTIGLFIAFQASIGQWVRPHYMQPIAVTSQMGPGLIDGNIPTGAWQLSNDIVTRSGQTVGDIFPAAPSQCQAIIQQNSGGPGPGGGIRIKAVRAPGAGGDPIDACLNAAGWHQVAKYQPSYRFWDFQRIETGIYLGMAALFVGGTYVLVLKRDA
jgi:ABC-type transport system involved in multi-copper enzyme maturation permease subunit